MARFDAFAHDTDSIYNYSKFSPSNGSLASMTMPDQSYVLKFKERSARLYDIENQKNQLIQDLIARLEITENIYDQTRLDHQREMHYNRESQLEKVRLQEEMQRINILMNRNAFVVVLIDGDGMVFDDELVKKGEKGGKDAANLLWAKINEYVTQSLPHASSPKIIARVYANVKDLGHVMQKSGIIDDIATFESFARGFNDKLLFDFVDVGSGKKDLADDKISELFKLYLHDCHCHQILFGCSHDNGYARLLDDVASDVHSVDRVTLLEGVPFERELALLKNDFKTTKFDHLFRDKKLAVNHQVWAPTAPVFKTANPLQRPLQTVTATLAPIGSPLSRTNTNETSGSSKASTPGTTWATMTAKPFVPSGATQCNTIAGNARTPPPAAIAVSVPGIDHNKHGQRVDKQDDSIPREDIQRIKKMKLCNVYFLQGNAACNRSQCGHDHEYNLSKYEKKVLEQVARMTPCFYKTACDDPNCIYGHRCPQSKPGEKECWYKQDCRFWGWGHGIETKIVKTVKV